MDTTIELGDLPIALERPASAKPSLDEKDAALITAAKGGDENAFCQLVERWQDPIYHFCYQWTQDSDDAREMCQDTFVRAYQAMSRFQVRGSWSAWLYRIALNLCRDRHKSKSNRKRNATDRLETASWDLACSRPGPDETAARSSDLRKLQRGIEALAPKLRAVVILRAIEELDQETCAEILGCSVRAVEGRYYQARKKLLEWWEKDSAE